MSPLIVQIALGIVNTYSQFQVNIFSNNRYYNISQFLHDNNNNSNNNNKARLFESRSPKEHTCEITS